MSNQPVSDRKAFGISNWLSSSALRISLCRRNNAGEPIEHSHCTGFLWQHGKDRYLITNWHCVTGWHPIKDRPLNDMAFEPELLRVPIMFEGEAREDVEGRKIIKRRGSTALVNLRQGERATWLEHPRFGRSVDVVAIRLGRLNDGELFSKPINAHEFDDLQVAVGDEAFVIGFPKHMQGGHGFPIWKRASIATEPDFDLDRLPKLLIDTATRAGMSGSPVIAVHRGTHQKRGDTTLKFGSGQSFLGVYSSRIGDDELGVQLGTVWKASVLDEIIGQGVRGRGPHDGGGDQAAGYTATEGLTVIGAGRR